MIKLIEQLFIYGKLAKDTKCEKEKDKIILKMSDICHQLRPVEPEFKAVYPQWDELYDILLSEKRD